ncbi:PREDICTED: uncharacterized protein LOC104803582 isoform X2 [Tarenaya hassleriana]|uniref:uncharacterized protein LOC104803582 isoform X2 n=1 Tax=Tarenaya hassleriana TaxID=28532 RepID=UPI00053C5769|nr:PREDICTED: uncharacterized protein LOC104803582 isoform X2 [Tarenaya hassleriana]
MLRKMTEEGEALTFPMMRESEAASRLKSTVSYLLPQLSDDYSDDVLAEYITVLVCNGKSQRQAREDLQAFLGDQSEGFVSCLWELLRKELSRDGLENFASDPMAPAEFGAHDNLMNRHSNSEGTKDYTNNTFSIATGVKGRINGSSRRLKATENDDWNSSPSIYSRKLSSIVVSGFQQPGGMNPDKFEKTAHQSSRAMQQPCLPKEETNTKYSQSIQPVGLVSDGYCDAPSYCKTKPRISVWDRLGSLNSDLFKDLKNPRMPETDIQSHEKQIPHANGPAFLAANGEHFKRFQREVTAVGNRHKSFQSHTARQLETGIITCNGPPMAHNRTSKRRYGDICSNAGDDSVNQVSRVLHREPSQDIERPKSLSYLSAKSDLLSEILNTKKKLLQIEMRILQSKQLKKQKVGALPSESGELQARQDDVESKSIHVTNVHFAATEEAISVFFAKCGAVENVVIVTNPESLKPIGAAFVTFASKESVDRAILLSGSAFYSRTVKSRS